MLKFSGALITSHSINFQSAPLSSGTTVTGSPDFTRAETALLTVPPSTVMVYRVLGTAFSTTSSSGIAKVRDGLVASLVVSLICSDSQWSNT